MWLQMGKRWWMQSCRRRHSPPLHPCHASWSDSACVTKTYTYICIYIHPTARIGSFVWRFWSTTQRTWQCHTDVPWVHICTPCLYVRHLCLSDICIYTRIHTFLCYSFIFALTDSEFWWWISISVSVRPWHPLPLSGSLASHHPSLAMQSLFLAVVFVFLAFVFWFIGYVFLV